MAATNYAALTDEEKTVWARDVWKAARNAQFLNRYIGTGAGAMIQRITELTKDERGARAVITLVADLEGDGVAGDRTLEGNEEANKAYDQVIQIDQLRHANRHEGKMAEQKSVVRFRENSRDTLAYWLADRSDQLAFLTMSGVSYATKTNGALRVGSDFPYLAYASDVKAPTANRHLQWDEATKSLIAVDHSVLVNGAIGTGDYVSWNMMVEAKAYAKDNFIKPIRGDEGMEVYNVFMTPKSMARLKLDPDFLAAYRNAYKTSPSNPLFKGMDVIYIDGLAIREFRHVFNTVGLTAGNKWGSGGNVDGNRVLFCGAQAMGYADIGSPEWVEKGFDYDNQQGISVGKIMGMLKPQFNSQVTDTMEDFGILCIDTAQ